MSGMADSEEAGEEEKDGEQTCEGGIYNPIRASRLSSFLQAAPVKHDTARSARVN